MNPMKKKHILYGKNSVIEAIKEGKTIEWIYVNKMIKNSELQELYELSKSQNIPVKKIPIEKLNYILFPYFQHQRISHQGIIAYTSEFEYFNIDDIYNQLLQNGKTPLFVYLDGITDVRNFGAIARSAVCFDLDAIILPVRNSVSVNSDSMNTSAGALYKIPVCRVDDVMETFDYFKNSGFQIIGADEKGEQGTGHIDWNLPTILVLGNEHKGISSIVENYLTKKISIEMNLAQFDSLNVSVAAGILMHSSYCVRVRH
jgi:23S rRNA (guanosine2251-2'-O)-methyltransferase